MFLVPDLIESSIRDVLQGGSGGGAVSSHLPDHKAVGQMDNQGRYKSRAETKDGQRSEAEHSLLNVKDDHSEIVTVNPDLRQRSPRSAATLPIMSPSSPPGSGWGEASRTSA